MTENVSAVPAFAMRGGLGRLGQVAFNGVPCGAVPPNPGFAAWDQAAGRFRLTVPGDPFAARPYGQLAAAIDLSPQPNCSGHVLLAYTPLLPPASPDPASAFASTTFMFR